jgi:mono/diheme cytochrome c family protein
MLPLRWHPAHLAFAICLLGSPTGAAPVIPGLHGRALESPILVGRLLVEELRCGACHEGFPTAEMKAAPNLADVAGRVRIDHLIRMIEDPAAARSGSTMPQMLAGRSPAQRREIAADITAFLSSLVNRVAPTADPAPNGVARADHGRQLFHSTGCIACHPARGDLGDELPAEGALSLIHVDAKYSRDSLSAFLLDPLTVRPSGRMPSLNLNPQEARDVAAYLVSDEEVQLSFPPALADGARIRSGREYFVSLNCASCHPLDDLSGSRRGPPRARLDPARGCLSDRPEAAPDFSLNRPQRDSIRAFLQGPIGGIADASDELWLTLTRFNCLACHERDGRGGVTPDLERYFQSTEEGLGNDARIPPPLTLAGAKLRREWMTQVLLEGRRVRPYQQTRMPQFGPGVARLPEQLADADALLQAPELTPPNRQENRPFRDAARALLGDKGLNCVACHNFNGKDSPGFKGLDLATSYQRLQPGWFAAYLKNPLAFRPGTVMPNFWPGGVAVQTEILGGDTEAQLRALWYYFSLGHSAADPPGIRSESTVLHVHDRVRTYRGRNHTTGYRGIAVGFPGGWNYSFNAEYGTLAAVWRGGFINVNWQGQGAGNFNPAGRETVVAEDVSFARLDDPASAWPLRPKMTKENPVNPDPLYPRNHGYAFRGYSLDADDVPTFRYVVDGIEVRDRTVVLEQADGAVLKRRLELEAPVGSRIHFRPLVGKVTVLADDVYRAGRLRLRVGSAAVSLRPSPEKPDEQELLIELQLRPGTNIHELEYALDE